MNAAKRCAGFANKIECEKWHRCPFNERHLKRLLSEYVSYHHEDRTHRGLGKETPGGRTRSLPSGHIGSQPRLGGLQHRYDRAA